MLKTIKYLLPATLIDMGGFPVKQALPTQNVQQLDPFLLLHHGQAKFTDRKLAKHQGVGPHPHRGFAPVTFVIEGEVHHRDSRGNSQVAREGEVQWMYTGAGIIHSERPSQALVEGSKRQEIIQLWINSPASKKMVPPEYYHLSKADMTTFNSTDGLVENTLVAGSYDGLQSKMKPQSDLLILWSRGQENGKISVDIPPGFNSMLYVVKGQLSVKDYGLVDGEQLAIFDVDGESIDLSVNEADTQFILLSGEPIGEEVTQQGPFVMNTQTEILEAMRDYQMGKMGFLVEDDLDP